MACDWKWAVDSGVPPGQISSSILRPWRAMNSRRPILSMVRSSFAVRRTRTKRSSSGTHRRLFLIVGPELPPRGLERMAAVVAELRLDRRNAASAGHTPLPSAVKPGISIWLAAGQSSLNPCPGRPSGRPDSLANWRRHHRELCCPTARHSPDWRRRGPFARSALPAGSSCLRC